MNDVMFLIKYEQFAKEITKTNALNNAASKKSRAPTTSGNGV